MALKLRMLTKDLGMTEEDLGQVEVAGVRLVRLEMDAIFFQLGKYEKCYSWFDRMIKTRKVRTNGVLLEW